MNMVAEGVKTADSVHTLAEQHDLDLPICSQVYRVVQGDITGDDAYRGLFSVRAGHEAEPG